MVSFQITAIMLFAFVFLPHEGFSVIKKEYDYESEEETIEIFEKRRENCRDEINNFFPETSDVLGHAKHAMRNYSIHLLEKNRTIGNAMVYYYSFKNFLLQGEIKLPDEFCEDRFKDKMDSHFEMYNNLNNESDQENFIARAKKIYDIVEKQNLCSSYLKWWFGAEIQVILNKAFYGQVERDIIRLKDDLTTDYWHSIVNGFQLNIENFLDPNALCDDEFKRRKITDEFPEARYLFFTNN